MLEEKSEIDEIMEDIFVPPIYDLESMKITSIDVDDINDVWTRVSTLDLLHGVVSWIAIAYAGAKEGISWKVGEGWNVVVYGNSSKEDLYRGILLKITNDSEFHDIDPDSESDDSTRLDAEFESEPTMPGKIIDVNLSPDYYYLYNNEDIRGTVCPYLSQYIIFFNEHTVSDYNTFAAKEYISAGGKVNVLEFEYETLGEDPHTEEVDTESTETFDMEV